MVSLPSSFYYIVIAELFLWFSWRILYAVRQAAFLNDVSNINVRGWHISETHFWQQWPRIVIYFRRLFELPKPVTGFCILALNNIEHRCTYTTISPEIFASILQLKGSHLDAAASKLEFWCPHGMLSRLLMNLYCEKHFVFNLVIGWPLDLFTRDTVDRLNL